MGHTIRHLSVFGNTMCSLRDIKVVAQIRNLLHNAFGSKGAISPFIDLGRSVVNMYITVVVTSLFFASNCLGLPLQKVPHVETKKEQAWEKDGETRWIMWPRGLGQIRIIGVTIREHEVWIDVGIACPNGRKILYYGWKHQKLLGNSQDCNGVRTFNVAIPQQIWKNGEAELPPEIIKFLNRKQREWLQSIVPSERA